MSKISDRKINWIAATAVVALLLLAAAFAAHLLAGKKSQLLYTNSVPAATPVAMLPAGRAVCINGSPPAGTGEIRFWLTAAPGSATRVKVSAGGAAPLSGSVVTRAALVAQRVMLSPARRPARATREPSSAGGGASPRRVCFTAERSGLSLLGTAADPADPPAAGEGSGSGVDGRVRIAFLSGSAKSYWSQISRVAHRAALFRPGWVGPGTFYLLAALAALTLLLAVFALVRFGQGGWPLRRWALLVACVTLVNGFTWSVVTPPFHVPDEQEHFAYIDTLANRGLPNSTPGKPPGAYTKRFSTLLGETFYGVALYHENKPPWDAAEERRWRQQDHRLAADKSAGGVSSAAQYAPIYYGAALVPYEISGGDLITRDWAVRLMSVLMTALAAVLALLTARLIAPKPEWFAPVVGLTVAFEPMLLHIGAAAHPDALVNLLGCALIYGVALTLKRGLSVRRTLAVGGIFGLMVAVKPVGIGLAPALLLAAWFAVRRDPRPPRDGLRDLGAAALLATVIIAAIYIAFGASSSTGSSLVTGRGVMPFSFTGLLSYVWQWFLPPLHFMFVWFGSDLFAHPPPVISILVPGFIANFNHLDTTYTFAFYRGLALLFIAIGAVVAAGGYRARARISEWGPFAAFALVAVAGLLAFLIISAYLLAIKSNMPLVQGRYLLPLVPLAGFFVASAAATLGRRWGLVFAAALVTCVGLLNLFSYGLSLERFYL